MVIPVPASGASVTGSTPSGIASPRALGAAARAGPAVRISASFRLMNTSYVDSSRQKRKPLTPSRKPARTTYMYRNRQNPEIGNRGSTFRFSQRRTAIPRSFAAGSSWMGFSRSRMS